MPKKSPIKQSGWSLKDLFESFDDPRIEQTYANLTAQITQFESYRSELKPSLTIKRFLEIIRKLHTAFPQLHLKAWTAVEIDWFSKISKRSVKAVLE